MRKVGLADASLVHIGAFNPASGGYIDTLRISDALVPETGSTSCRSLRTLRKTIAEKLAAKAAALDQEEADAEESSEETHGQAEQPELESALAGLSLEPVAKLKGVPTPVGTHIRHESRLESAERTDSTDTVL